LRMYGAVANWRRRANCDVVVGGVDIPAGSNIVISLASANRDEKMFEDPDRFDVHRENARRHLTFGNGIHMCLGAPLARMEMRFLVEELATRFPDCAKAPGHEPSYAKAFAFRAPASLLVDLQGAPQ
jgi:cytochrome P450